MVKKKEWPKKKPTEKTTPKTTGQKKMKANSSGDTAWAKATKKAKSMGFDLNKAVKHRSTLSKGSQEYNVVQNQINSAMGVKKKRKVAGAPRDKDVKMANAKKSLKKKLPKTVKAIASIGKKLGTKPKTRKKRVAGGM